MAVFHPQLWLCFINMFQATHFIGTSWNGYKIIYGSQFMIHIMVVSLMGLILTDIIILYHIISYYIIFISYYPVIIYEDALNFLTHVLRIMVGLMGLVWDDRIHHQQ